MGSKLELRINDASKMHEIDYEEIRIIKYTTAVNRQQKCATSIPYSINHFLKQCYKC